jgi:putative lipoprotein
MRKTAIAIALAAALSAQADEWTGPDKVQHAVMGTAIGAVTTAATESKALGFGAGCLAGLAKELSDGRTGGTGFSAKDLTVTCAGALVGIFLGEWMLSVQRNRVSVSKAF